MLEDIGLDVSALTRLRQWLLPIDPRAYRSIEERLLERRAALSYEPIPTRSTPSESRWMGA